MNDIDIGSLGETRFEAWCKEVGITCNKSIEDKEAWDFIIEFEEDMGSAPTTLDESAAGYKCFIQVKASQNESSNKSITLRNWMKMVKNPNPVFIVRIEFDGIEPKKVYLIHVGEELIRKALEKLRGLTNQQSFMLKRKMNYPFSQNELLKERNGESIKNGILSSIPKGMYKYCNDKTHYVETVGYEGDEFKFTISLDQESQKPVEELFVDLSLGKHLPIPFTEGEIKTSRFGVYSNIKNIGSGILSINPSPTGECILKLKNEKTKKLRVLKMKYFVPQIKGIDANHKHFKFLIKDKFFEIEASLGKNLIKFNFTTPPHTESVNLSDYENAIRFHEIIQDSIETGGGIVCEMIETKNNRKVEFNFDPVKEVDPTYAAEIELMKKTLKVLEFFNINEEIANLFAGIHDYGRVLDFVGAYLLGGKEIPQIRMTGALYENKTQYKNSKAIPFILLCKLGKYSLYFGFYAKGKFKIDSKRGENGYEFEFLSNKIKLIEHDFRIETDSSEDETISNKIHELVKIHVRSNTKMEIVDVNFKEKAS